MDPDLAPAVDRHERGLYQEIDSRDAEPGAMLPEPRIQLTSTSSTTDLDDDAGSSDSTQRDRPVIALSGGGGFPLMVTGLAGRQKADAPGLLASLPTVATSRSDAAVQVDPNAAIATATVALAVAEERFASPDRFECPDYVKAAVGLALGLGLTSGPLFPDLLTSTRPRRPVAPERPFPKFRDWFRRRKPR
jgi:hypothetical protein